MPRSIRSNKPATPTKPAAMNGNRHAASAALGVANPPGRAAEICRLVTTWASVNPITAETAMLNLARRGLVITWRRDYEAVAWMVRECRQEADL